ncbi:hypothetical protein [Paraburkholderia caledonica]|uniref:Uncharacterized protein n=1 Tax=Paraburkholderia caledonica TaxID=134536 RepID=A0AB73INS6_9BURK|nr:hypothetical protein [Paraburkholderia caledonica]
MIRWKKDERETGLRAVAQVRCHSLRDSESGKLLMYTHCPPPYMRTGIGDMPWKWHLRMGDKTLTSKACFATGDEAKAAADAYWKANRDKILEANGLSGKTEQQC